MSFSLSWRAEAPDQVRPRPAFLRALGAADPPARIEIGGTACALRDVFKHDSWAATALYAAQDGRRFICKFNRQEALFGLPLGWLGRLLARREAAFLAAFGDLPNVPAPAGAVTFQGRPLAYAVARQFVAGRPLGTWEHTPDDFFPTLEKLLAEIHRRGFAYVDLHKCENVIRGDDGQPYLIDFQISQGPWSRLPLLRQLSAALLTVLQRSDCYHLAKMHRRSRPERFVDANCKAGLPPWWIWLHRLVAIPFRTLRRQLLVLLRIRSGAGQVNSEQFAEDAFRQALPNLP